MALDSQGVSLTTGSCSRALHPLPITAVLENAQEVNVGWWTVQKHQHQDLPKPLPYLLIGLLIAWGWWKGIEGVQLTISTEWMLPPQPGCPTREPCLDEGLACMSCLTLCSPGSNQLPFSLYFGILGSFRGSTKGRDFVFHFLLFSFFEGIRY